MKEITFIHPTSKLTRTIKVCETQKEIVDVIRKRRIFEDGSIFVLYKNGGSFYQLLGSDGWKAGYFRRCGINSATVSSFSGELFIFGDFAITPDGLVCIGEENIEKYGSYSGQYDVNSEKAETKTEKAETKTEKAETKTEKAETKTEKAETKIKTTINMKHFEDDMDYFMEHFEDEYCYELIIWN